MAFASSMGLYRAGPVRVTGDVWVSALEDRLQGMSMYCGEAALECLRL